MTESRKLAMQSAFIRKLAAMEEARAADTDTDSDVGGGYDCGYGGCEIGDGEDSGYTEIPMTDGACGGGAGGGSGGLRDRVARFVFRSRTPQQPQQTPLPPPPPASAQARRRRAAEFAGYAYTRWAFQRPAADTASATAAATAKSKQAATAAAASAPLTPPLMKCASARTVRFRCPYEEAASAAESATLVRPYSTSAFACPPQPQHGERSASSGYGSDIDAASTTSPVGGGVGGSGVDSGDHWAVREEDIDRLLCAGRTRRPPPRLMTHQRQPQPLGATPTLPDEADDLDVTSLDLAAFFPPAPAGSAAAAVAEDAAAANQIDRIVSDVVRLKGAARSCVSRGGGGGGCGGSVSGSPWWQQRREFVPAPPSAAGDCLELTELQPAAVHSYDFTY